MKVLHKQNLNSAGVSAWLRAESRRLSTWRLGQMLRLRLQLASVATKNWQWMREPLHREFLDNSILRHWQMECIHIPWPKNSLAQFMNSDFLWIHGYESFIWFLIHTSEFIHTHTIINSGFEATNAYLWIHMISNPGHMHQFICINRVHMWIQVLSYEFMTMNSYDS